MRRVLTPELMDDPGLDPAAHARALRGLARLNRLAASDRILWEPIRREAARRAEPLNVLDIATGSGDVPLALASRARRAGFELRLSACDVSDVALGHARARAAAAGLHLDAWRHDAVGEPFTRRFDVVICSLFLHHLSENDAGAFLRNASEAAAGILLVSDLRRDYLGLTAAWAASRLVTRSPIVRVDAVRSVRGAYTIAEAAAIARRAGLAGASIRACWPRRMLLTWRRA